MRALTQEELLAEAAETELLNTASLARLIAVEEEARAPLWPCSAGRGALSMCCMPRQCAIYLSYPVMLFSKVTCSACKNFHRACRLVTPGACHDTSWHAVVVSLVPCCLGLQRNVDGCNSSNEIL